MSQQKTNPIDLALRDSISYVKKCPYESTGTKLDGKFNYFAVEGVTVCSLKYDASNDKVVINENTDEELVLPAVLPPSMKQDYFFSEESAQAYGRKKNEEVFEEVSEFVKESIALQSYLKQLIEEGC